MGHKSPNLNPSFSERISMGHKRTNLIEDHFRISLNEGSLSSENQKILGREVKCDYGRADLLLTDWIVEIKEANQWKQGVGQLIVYGKCWPDKGKWMHIHFGDAKVKKGKFRGMVEDGCEAVGIRLTWDDKV